MIDAHASGANAANGVNMNGVARNGASTNGMNAAAGAAIEITRKSALFSGDPQSVSRQNLLRNHKTVLFDGVVKAPVITFLKDVAPPGAVPAIVVGLQTGGLIFPGAEPLGHIVRNRL